MKMKIEELKEEIQNHGYDCDECNFKNVCDTISFDEISDCDYGYLFNKLLESRNANTVLRAMNKALSKVNSNLHDKIEVNQ
jgi:hypothetical protein